MGRASRARGITRRTFLWISLTASAAGLAACAVPPPVESPPPSPTATPTPTPSPPPSPSPPPAPSPTPAATVPPVARTLYRDAALADGRSARLRLGVSLLVEEGRIAWIRPSDAEEDPGERAGLEIVDASGATIVPGMVDAHSHVTLPGGARWIERASDPTERLLEYAEANARLAFGAGVRWFRDVGSPRRTDPADGRERALALGLRDRWRGRAGYPYLRAAGTWLTRAGSLPAGLSIEVRDADELLAAALAQLDEGADLVKLYLDGPDAASSPWTVTEVERVVAAVHRRGAKVTAHSLHRDGALVGAEAGVDSIEHGWEIDADVARTMAEKMVFLVSTLTVIRSWLTFARTTRLARFAAARGRRTNAALLEKAEASVRAAHAAGVRIAAGTDFGGGSARANQLAWEVGSLVAAGLEPHEALAAATWRGGALLGEPEAGVIREGGPADFFLVHGDPLSDPGALWRVWRVA